MAEIDTMKRLRAIRRLSSPAPGVTAQERLEEIAGIASGKREPRSRHFTSGMDARVLAGQASRSPQTEEERAAAKAALEAKVAGARREEGGRNRMARGGRDRSE